MRWWKLRLDVFTVVTRLLLLHYKTFCGRNCQVGSSRVTHKTRRQQVVWIKETQQTQLLHLILFFFFLHIIQLYNLIRLCVPQHPRMPKRKKSQAAQSQNDLPAAVRTSASTAQHVSDFETYWNWLYIQNVDHFLFANILFEWENSSFWWLYKIQYKVRI